MALFAKHDVLMLSAPFDFWIAISKFPPLSNVAENRLISLLPAAIGDCRSIDAPCEKSTGTFVTQFACAPAALTVAARRPLVRCNVPPLPRLGVPQVPHENDVS